MGGSREAEGLSSISKVTQHTDDRAVGLTQMLSHPSQPLGSDLSDAFLNNCFF